MTSYWYTWYFRSTALDIRIREHFSLNFSGMNTTIRVCVFLRFARVSLCFSIFPPQSVISEHTEAHTKLKLSNVTEKDAGKYWCRASNFVGRSEKAFWLKIHKPGKSWALSISSLRHILCCAPPLCGAHLGCGFSLVPRLIDRVSILLATSYHLF